MSLRIRPNVDHTHLVRTHSSRNGAPIKLIVMHDTEGANLPGIKDLVGLGNYFDSTLGTPRASSSNVATDAGGNSARFVRDIDKAWAQAYYNPWSLSIENIGFVTQKTWPKAQIEEDARWIAYWCHHHQIRCYKGQVTANGLIVKTGVVRHSDLKALGGGHVDPGNNFPLADCMERARFYLKKY